MLGAVVQQVAAGVEQQNDRTRREPCDMIEESAKQPLGALRPELSDSPPSAGGQVAAADRAPAAGRQCRYGRCRRRWPSHHTHQGSHLATRVVGSRRSWIERDGRCTARACDEMSDGARLVDLSAAEGTDVMCAVKDLLVDVRIFR